MKSKSIIHYITKYTIDVMFFAGIIACLCIPLILRWSVLGAVYARQSGGHDAMMAVLYISGVLAVYILYNLKKMFKTLLGGNPFVTENVVALRRCGVACGVIALVYFLKCALVFFTVGCGIIAVVFSVGCLFCLTLKDIFKAAVEYKEENDLTI